MKPGSEWEVVVNKTAFACIKQPLMNISSVVKDYVEQNPDSTTFQIYVDIDELKEENNQLLTDFFLHRKILFSPKNRDIISILFEKLNISNFDLFFSTFKYGKNVRDQFIQMSSEISYLFEIETMIYSLNMENLQTIISRLSPILKDKVTLARMLFNACIARPRNIELYVLLLIKVDNQLSVENPSSEEIGASSILSNFKKIVFEEIITPQSNPQIHFFTTPSQPSSYIISLLSKNNLISLLDLIHLQNFNINLSQYTTIKNKQPNSIIYDANDGYDMDPILTAIRHDDFDSFQQMTALYTNNDFFYTPINISCNERTKYFALYDERTKYFSLYYEHHEITLISYAAKWSAFKIFKFLFLHLCNDENFQRNPHFNNLTFHAIEGGCIEIIHILEQKGLGFEKAVICAIEYHQSDISRWLIETKERHYLGYDRIAQTIVQRLNVDIFCEFIISNKRIRENVVCYAAQYGYLVLMQFFQKMDIDLNLKFSDRCLEFIGYAPIHIACQKGFIEVIDFLLKNNISSINEKAVHNNNSLSW